MPKEYVFQTPKSAFDDLFGASVSITEINIMDLEKSSFNKFKPYTDEKMQELVASIKQNGVLEPIIVRPNNNGGYEILAGHNRTAACRLAGKEKIPAIIKENITDNEALNIVAYTNLKRDKIYPSELAQTYKLLMEVNNATSCRNLADLVGDNERKVQRYYRLNYLIDDIMEMVDEEKISITVGVLISNLENYEQDVLVEFIKEHNIKLKEDDAQILKRYRTETDIEITEEVLKKLLLKENNKREKNSNMKHKFEISQSIYDMYFKDMTKQEIEIKMDEIINFYFENNN